MPGTGTFRVGQTVHGSGRAPCWSPVPARSTRSSRPPQTHSALFLGIHSPPGRALGRARRARLVVGPGRRDPSVGLDPRRCNPGAGRRACCRGRGPSGRRRLDDHVAGDGLDSGDLSRLRRAEHSGGHTATGARSGLGRRRHRSNLSGLARDDAVHGFMTIQVPPCPAPHGMKLAV